MLLCKRLPDVGALAQSSQELDRRLRRILNKVVVVVVVVVVAVAVVVVVAVAVVVEVEVGAPWQRAGMEL